MNDYCEKRVEACWMKFKAWNHGVIGCRLKANKTSFKHHMTNGNLMIVCSSFWNFNKQQIRCEMEKRIGCQSIEHQLVLSAFSD